MRIITILYDKNVPHGKLYCNCMFYCLYIKQGKSLKATSSYKSADKLFRIPLLNLWCEEYMEC